MSGSSIKTVVVLAVLAGIAYAVYVTLNKSPESSVLQGFSGGWSSGPPKVEMPGSNTPAPLFPNAPAPSRPGTASSDAPIWSPPAAQPPAAPAYPVGAVAPPFGAGGAGPAATTPGAAWPRAPASSAASLPGAAVPVAAASAPPPAIDAARASDVGAGLAGSPSPVPPSAGTETDMRKVFAFVMQKAAAKLSNGQLAEAHLELSEWYGDPRLTAEESRQLTDLLSQLAGTVVYSRQHLLEPPYVVQPGDTLEKIARTYNVPWQLLAKINGVRDPNDLQTGRQIKVVRGPFHAVVDLGRYELTLMLDGRYAGRFAIGIGRDCPPLEGRYLVRSKTTDPTCYDADQREDPTKPLGSRWIDLGGGVGLHGTNHPENVGRRDGRGVIFLADRDIEDLYDILTAGSNSSNGSSVLIRR